MESRLPRRTSRQSLTLAKAQVEKILSRRVVSVLVLSQFSLSRQRLLSFLAANIFRYTTCTVSKNTPIQMILPRSRTRIILLFNHESEKPDYVEHLMSREDAYSKIEKRLTSLNKNTLLFTRNIREIRWETNDRSGHYLREDDISDSARMTTITDGEHLKKYLVFSREPIWEGKVHKAVDVAFSIDEKGAIVSAEEDFLYVLFATERETPSQIYTEWSISNDSSTECHCRR